MQRIKITPSSVDEQVGRAADIEIADGPGPGITDNRPKDAEKSAAAPENGSGAGER